MPLACLYGRCLGGNLCQIYSSRGDSGPMSHFSDYSSLHANSHSCISQKVHANRAFISYHRNEFDWLSPHLCLFGAHFVNSTRNGSSVPVVQDA